MLTSINMASRPRLVDFAPKGLNEETIKFISKEEEPQWMLDWRLDAFERWKAMEGRIGRVLTIKSTFRISVNAALKISQVQSLLTSRPELLKT